MRLAVVPAVGLLAVVGVTGCGSGSTSTRAPEARATSTPASPTTLGPETTLSAGTFTGGKDVPVGSYYVFPPEGQYGTFTVGSSSFVLGNPGPGVASVHVQIKSGEHISVSGMTDVSLVPVATPGGH